VSRSYLDYSMQLDRQGSLPSSGRVPFALPVYSHFWRTHAPLVLILPVYLRAARTHTSGILTCRSYSHFWRTYVPLVITYLAWVGCSRAIRHAQRALHRIRTHMLCVILSAFSHALHGLVVLAVSIMPGVV